MDENTFPQISRTKIAQSLCPLKKNTQLINSDMPNIKGEYFNITLTP